MIICQWYYLVVFRTRCQCDSLHIRSSPRYTSHLVSPNAPPKQMTVFAVFLNTSCIMNLITRWKALQLDGSASIGCHYDDRAHAHQQKLHVFLLIFLPRREIALIHADTTMSTTKSHLHSSKLRCYSSCNCSPSPHKPRR